MAVVEHTGTVMACELHVIVHQPGDPLGLLRALDLLDRLESLWSRFVETSDITRINAADGAPVRVASETVTLIQTMQAAAQLTQGRYDPTVLPILVADGYATSRIDPDSTTILGPGALHSGAVDQVQVDAVRSTVSSPAGTALDAGGIGKGLAADMAMALLLRSGAGGALVSIGGDLAAGGDAPEPEGWRIDVESSDPGSAPLCRAMVDGGGVATSSTRSLRWSHNGRSHHHVIDPFTGAQSGTDLSTVTVFAATAWRAEAFATAAILAGSKSVIDFLHSHELSGIGTTDDGTTLRTDDLGALFVGSGSTASAAGSGACRSAAGATAAAGRSPTAAATTPDQ